MRDYAPRRPLGETIAELSAGAHGASGDRMRSLGIVATGIELSLPVETMFEGEGEELVVLSDVRWVRSFDSIVVGVVQVVSDKVAVTFDMSETVARVGHRPGT